MMVQGADANANTSGYNKTLVVSTAPARLYSVTVYNNGGADAYIQVFDTIAVQTAGAWTSGAEPRIMMRVPAASGGSFDFGDGRIFQTGISIAGSTVPGSYTAVGATDLLIDATYRVK